MTHVGSDVLTVVAHSVVRYKYTLIKIIKIGVKIVQLTYMAIA